MHVQRVITNETCNQNCWFCNARRPAEAPDFIARPAVRRRVDAARAGTPREIVLTGGEPTLRSDLADLVARAAQGGAQVVLETNAARIDAPRARALAAAGLAIARVQLVAWGEADADAITREPGGFAAALRGIGALADAGVRVEVTTPVVRRNLDLVAGLPRGIAESGLPIAALVLVTPVSAPDPGEVAALPDMARAVAAVADEARRVGLVLRFDPTSFVAPCAFGEPGRVAHLFALNRGNAKRPGFERVAACARCLVNDCCPGLPLAAVANAASVVTPIADQRLRRRLTATTSVEEQIARELISRDGHRDLEGAVPEHTVRVNFHCNQACEFCFVSTHLPPAAETAIRAAIEEAAGAGAVLVLSGGEPTLNPRLLDYVRLGKRLGVREIELQTNATRLGDRALTEALRDAGVDRAMVSLHGSTAEISDFITGAPGTFDATLRGIDELLHTPIRVRLNYVFCQANRDDFARYIDFVAARWPSMLGNTQAATGIVLSFVASHTDIVPRTGALIPTFTDVLPALVAGLKRAREIGLHVGGFDSMCGLPLCIVPESERELFSRVALPPGAGGGEFVKAEACARCAEAERCFGVRRGYAELHGTAELHPIGA